MRPSARVNRSDTLNYMYADADPNFFSIGLTPIFTQMQNHKIFSRKMTIKKKNLINKAQRPNVRPHEFWGVSSYLSTAIATLGGRYARELF